MPFDLEDPVNTPRGLGTSGNPGVLEALAKGVKTLTEAGIALDAKLGDIQSTSKNDQVIPLHGSEGYPVVTGSSASWIMAGGATCRDMCSSGQLSQVGHQDPAYCSVC